MQYYYVDARSQQIGPVDAETLKKAAITRDTLVWKEGMKEWLPAAQLPELKMLFLAPPAAAEKKVGPPPLPAKQPAPPAIPPKSSDVSHPSKNNLKRLIIPAAIVIVVAGVAAFLLLRPEPSRTQVYIAADADSADIDNDDTARIPKETKDTTRIINIDSLGNNLKWDTTNAASDTGSTDKDVSFLPGFGGDVNTTSKKTKKTAPKKKREQQTEREFVQQEEEAYTPRREEPARANPAKMLTVTGTFRKNIFFEAILEGTIQNRNNAGVGNIVVEVSFLDGNGQSILTKRFEQPGTIAGGSSAAFRFKAAAPKGTKGARYAIGEADWD